MSGGIWEFPIGWEVLVSVSDSCLDGYVPGWIDKEVTKQLPGKITYRLWSDGLGDLGTVSITKLRTELSEVHFSGVPLGAERLPLPAEEDLDGKPQDVILAALRDHAERQRQRREAIERHHKNVVAQLLNCLSAANIWPVPEIGAGALPTPEGDGLPIPEGKTKYSPEDWAAIFRATSGEGRRPDYADIAQRTGKSEAYIRRKYSEWRDESNKMIP